MKSTIKTPDSQKKDKPKVLFFDDKLVARDMIQKRTDESLSVREAAKACGLKTISTYWAMEAHSRVPQVDSLLKVLNWLGKPVETYIRYK